MQRVRWRLDKKKKKKIEMTFAFADYTSAIDYTPESATPKRTNYGTFHYRACVGTATIPSGRKREGVVQLIILNNQ